MYRGSSGSSYTAEYGSGTGGGSSDRRIVPAFAGALSTHARGGPAGALPGGGDKDGTRDGRDGPDDGKDEPAGATGQDLAGAADRLSSGRPDTHAHTTRPARAARTRATTAGRRATRAEAGAAPGRGGSYTGGVGTSPAGAPRSSGSPGGGPSGRCQPCPDSGTTTATPLVTQARTRERYGIRGPHGRGGDGTVAAWRP